MLSSADIALESGVAGQIYKANGCAVMKMRPMVASAAGSTSSKMSGIKNAVTQCVTAFGATALFRGQKFDYP